jgi:hypothetical protein
VAVLKLRAHPLLRVQRIPSARTATRWPVRKVSTTRPVRWLRTVTAPCGHVPRKRAPVPVYGSRARAPPSGGPSQDTTTRGRAHAASSGVFDARLPWCGDCNKYPAIIGGSK